MNIIIHPRLVVIDVTNDYSLGNDAKLVEKIEDIFLYDESCHTYCCELIPSYYCIYLYTSIEFSAEANDHQIDELEQRYAYEPTEDCYIHCNGIKPIVVGESEVFEASTYDEAVEQVREDYSSNHRY